LVCGNVGIEAYAYTSGSYSKPESEDEEGMQNKLSGARKMSRWFPYTFSSLFPCVHHHTTWIAEKYRVTAWG
jgi:hypothetical protein